MRPNQPIRTKTTESLGQFLHAFLGAIQYNNKEATYATFQVGSPDPIKPGIISTYCVPPEREVQRQDFTGHCPVVFIHM